MYVYGMNINLYRTLEDLETEDSREYLNFVQVSG